MKNFFKIFGILLTVAVVVVIAIGFIMPGSYVDDRNCGVVEVASADDVPAGYELDADPEIRCYVAKIKQ